MFWTDCWLHGCSLADLAPEVVTCVPKSYINTRTVAQALEKRAWVRDIQCGLSLQGLMQYLC
uniref:Uncharacterized protein n=1 Tax=Arundo donax TaxID=35708 RepID=A0A0A9HXY4_ARUDO